MTFNSILGGECVSAMCDTIIENKAYLSEVDGAIGDGDHGINMAKGFSMCKEALNQSETPLSLAQSFSTLANILMGSIGGSMGPLYGSVFFGMADAIESKNEIDADAFAYMLEQGLASLQSISEAQVGDKCLMDTLVPAVQAFRCAIDEGKSYDDALQEMRKAAEQGRDSTKDLIARIGRASRLGERSRGILDAGAVSCCMLLSTLAATVSTRLN